MQFCHITPSATDRRTMTFYDHRRQEVEHNRQTDRLIPLLWNAQRRSIIREGTPKSHWLPAVCCCSFPMKRWIWVPAWYAVVWRSRWTVCWPRGQSSSTVHSFTATWVNCWASVSTGHFFVWQRSSEHWRRRLATSFCISGTSPTFSLTVPRLSDVMKISPGAAAIKITLTIHQHSYSIHLMSKCRSDRFQIGCISLRREQQHYFSVATLLNSDAMYETGKSVQ